MDFLILFLIITTVMPAISQALVESNRKRLFTALEQKRGSRVIALIHRQETMSILGIPLARYISIEDSERVLRAIHLTPADMPIDLVLHTPGGLVLAAHQIARALTRHKAKVTVFIPHYAMSGGTLLALAADEIIMSENAVLGPVDPQIGEYPAVSLLKLLEVKPVEKLSDQSLILADIANKALRQVEALVRKILLDHTPEVKIAHESIPRIAEALVSGIWTHDHPITVEDAQELGLPVTTNLPQEIFELMDLYQQPGATKSSVQFIPLPYKLDRSSPAGHSLDKK
ncbi:MAG: ATP-dependent Clp protease proteolytic subunit [Candidatus Melainabacteria bacterium]|nr:ATP-dependent Clp protease proteolytic subunit [Candidatus Melainabacteria bacterium]